MKFFNHRKIDKCYFIPMTWSVSFIISAKITTFIIEVAKKLKTYLGTISEKKEED